MEGVLSQMELLGGEDFPLVEASRQASAPQADPLSGLQGTFVENAEYLHDNVPAGSGDGSASVVQAILDHLSTGIVQLSATGTVIGTNRAAARLLETRDGLMLCRAGLRAALPADDARLQRAIWAASGVGSGVGSGHGPVEGGLNGYLRISRPSRLKSYVVIVSPLAIGGELSPCRPTVLALVTDPEPSQQLDEGALAAVFGFTPAEARLVALLATGQPLSGIAEQLRISVETARTQLAKARDKTGTSSQVDLVRKVLTALSPIARHAGGRPGRAVAWCRR